jgi:hypothetical protein
MAYHSTYHLSYQRRRVRMYVGQQLTSSDGRSPNNDNRRNTACSSTGNDGASFDDNDDDDDDDDDVLLSDGSLPGVGAAATRLEL